MTPENALNAEDVRKMMLGRMEKHLSLKTEGYRCPQLREQEAEMNAALQAAIPIGTPHGGLEVAIDTYDEPFYSKMLELRTYTCKTQAKAGTSRFSASPASIIWREVHLSLALTYVLPEDSLPQVVAKLLTRFKQVGLHATVLYLDKGFVLGKSSAICGVCANVSHSQQAGRHLCTVSRVG